jgi:hypothetical protein
MPDINIVHFDRALTTLSIKRINADFAADEVFGQVPVDKQSNKYFIYGQESFQPMDDARRPGAEANEMDWNPSSDLYYAEGHALKEIVPDELRANADQPLDVDADTVALLTDLINLNKERLAASLALDPATVTNNIALSGGALWSDPENSAPLDDVENAKPTIQKDIGRIPNRLLLSYPVYQALRTNSSIIERIKYSMPAFSGMLNAQLMAQAFDVEKVIVASSLYATSPLGVTPIVKDYVWGKSALLFYQPAAMGLRSVGFGSQFRWLFGMVRDGMGSTVGWLVKRWREEKRTGDYIEVQSYHALKVIVPGAACLFSPAIA